MDPGTGTDFPARKRSHMMHAIVARQAGGPEVLELDKVWISLLGGGPASASIIIC